MTTAMITDLRHGEILDFGDTEHKSVVYGLCDGSPFEVAGAGSVFGFVLAGEINIETANHCHRARNGQYFSLPTRSGMHIGGDGQGYVVFHPGFTALPCMGGPLEEQGRLKYIDGCSDSLLISPPLRGDPCFNFLHFPGGILQTKHTHPSIRVGMIHEGRGTCITEHDEKELRKGSLFLLAPDAIHAFATARSDGMSLTVYHPDSDFGPTHEEHPMLNRTIVDGVSARFIDAIRTKEIAS